MSALLTVQAKYSGGLLKPMRPLPFAEGEEVEVTVQRTTSTPAEVAKIPGVRLANPADAKQFEMTVTWDADS
jgi:predicted DNA-binding antitoxin AbrB/MazE fold protein